MDFDSVTNRKQVRNFVAINYLIAETTLNWYIAWQNLITPYQNRMFILINSRPHASLFYIKQVFLVPKYHSQASKWMINFINLKNVFKMLLNWSMKMVGSLSSGGTSVEALKKWKSCKIMQMIQIQEAKTITFHRLITVPFFSPMLHASVKYQVTRFKHLSW